MASSVGYDVVRYRVQQFLHALAAPWRTGALDERAAAEVLAPPQLALFRRMGAAERQHALQVLARVRGGGHQEPDLLVAALLHDVGKSQAGPRGLRLWERPWPVLARWLAPAWAVRWGAGRPAGWRRPFVVAAQHPRWGAELAEAAGCSPTAVALIRWHQAQPGPPEIAALLQVLQAADDVS